MKSKGTENFQNRMIVKVEDRREVKEENNQKSDDGFNNNVISIFGKGEFMK